MVKIELAAPEDVGLLVETCIRAFHTDVQFLPHGTIPAGPPGYNSEEWNLEMLNEGVYYKICADDQIVGGMILFDMHKYGEPAGNWSLGRMWVDSRFHNRGIGQEAVRQMFKNHPKAVCWRLDTPDWAVRNHHFYEKVGFTLIEKTAVDPETGWGDYIFECVIDQEERSSI